MVSTRVFVSYSRRDCYAAEYLTASLIRAGLTPWLDFHRLEPGADWAREIRDAIAAADAVVLLASPEAIRSAYVQSEWRDAIAHGKPIFIVRVRPAILPAELCAYPLIDLRPSLPAAVAALLAAFGMQPEGRHRQRFFRLPRAAVALAAYHATVCAVFAVLDLMVPRRYLATMPRALIVTMATPMAVVLVAAAVGVLVIVVSVLRSRYRSEYSFYLGFVLLLCIGQLILTHDWLTAHFGGVNALPAAPHRTCEVMSVLLALDVVFLAVAICYTGFSIALLVRTETLKADPLPRLRLLEGTGVQALPELSGLLPKLSARPLSGTFSATCRLDFAPPDARLAAWVQEILGTLGFTEGPATPDWTFVLVTGFTDLNQLEQLPEDQRERTIFLLGSSVSHSPDSVLFRTYQWIDFRDPSPAVLRRFLSTLADTGSEPTVLLPRSPTVFYAPAWVQLLYGNAVGMSGMLLLLSGKLFWTGEITPLSVLRAVGAVMAAGALLATGRRIAGRRLSAGAVRWLRVVVLALVALCGVLWTVNHELPNSGIETLAPPRYGEPDWHTALRPVLEDMNVVVGVALVVFAIAFFLMIGRAARWLPTRPVPGARLVYPARSQWAAQVVVCVVMAGLMIAFPVVA